MANRKSGKLQYFLLFILLICSRLESADSPTKEYILHLTPTLLDSLSVSGRSAGSEDLKRALLLPPEAQIQRILPQAPSILSGWYMLRLPVSAVNSISAMQQVPDILSFDENHRFRVHSEPVDDPYLVQQWYHQRIQSSAAWENFTINPKIIVGLIDTGIDYLHPDLQGSLWINMKEDLNGNGMRDEEDMNGIDDDGNGYIDDVIGWDFTDAPRFAGSGDDTEPDNDPMDEFSGGHGTEIAGIMAAQTDNGQGIAALVPGLRVMNLRAGTASGYLEEDDVARAVIYAMDNGAQIINMSFGDIVVSQFLRDVIEYAYSQNMIIVASAGNSGSTEIHYPSGLKETISVGATDEADKLASFSNRGGTVDLVAPGVDILSTSPGGTYQESQGTSFSAPMVSAAAAMLLCIDPSLSVEQVRNQLKTSAEDLGAAGWDGQFAAGRLDLKKATQLDPLPGTLMIHAPAAGSSTAADTVAVVITATGADLVSLNIEWGVGEDPLTWYTLIDHYAYQVVSDTIAILPLDQLPDTTVTFRLRILTWEGKTAETRSFFLIDRTAPQITNHDNLTLLDDDDTAVLVRFQTDDITNADLFFRSPQGSGSYNPFRLDYQTINHSYLFKYDEQPQSTDYYLRVINRSGLQTVDNNKGQYYHFTPRPAGISPDSFKETDTSLPAGYLLPEATEFENGLFLRKMGTAFTGIPRDAGDADGDGRQEILIGYGLRSYLLEAEDAGSWPSRVVWADSSGFWAGRICDLDGDGKNEIIGKSGQDFILLECTGDNQFSQEFRFENLSSGDNQLGPPRTEVTDLDGDGYQELIFGDYDGDLIIYENSGDNQFIYRTAIRLPLGDATNFFTSGNIFSGGRQTLIAGTHTSDQVNYEHEFAAQYWQFSVIESPANNTYRMGQQILIYGFADLREFECGIAAGAFAGEDNDLLFLAPYPDLYVFRADGDSLIPIWHQTNSNTNTILSADFDGNGRSEFYAHNGEKISAFEAGDASRPPAPAKVTAYPLNADSIGISWQAVVGASRYYLYRGVNPDGLVLLDSVVAGLRYTDRLVEENIRYYYALQTVSLSTGNPFSLLSRIVSAVPNKAPEVDTLIVKGERSVEIYFDEAMDPETLVPLNFKLHNEDLPVSSVIAFRNTEAALLSFAGALKTGYSYELLLSGLRDTSFTMLRPQDTSQTFIYTSGILEKPYIREWYFESDQVLVLRFNQEMNSESVLNTGNYSLEPSGQVMEVKMIDTLALAFRYRLSEDTYHGHSGVTTYLTMQNLSDTRGNQMNEGKRIALLEMVRDIGNLMVYPQPVTGQDDWLVFSNIAPGTEIRIYDINGHFITSLREEDQNGGLRWDLHDQQGRKIAAGIYIYYATFDNQQKIGKFTVVR